MQFLYWNVILIKNTHNYIPGIHSDNETALVQVMTLRQTGNKPLPEPMMTKFYGVYMRRPSSIW